MLLQRKGRTAVRRRPIVANARRKPASKAAAPPWDGWRTYGASRAAAARRPTAITVRPSVSSSRNGTAATTSPLVGRRFDVSLPGCVGTTFHSSTSSATPSFARTRWTIVAVASGRPGARQLALRRERDSADARAAVAGGFAHEHDLGRRTRAEIVAQTLSQERRVRVLVEGMADLRPGEAVYELQRFHLTTSSCLRRRCEKALVARSQSGSSAGRPTVTPVTIVTSSGIDRSLRQRASSSTGTP